IYLPVQPMQAPIVVCVRYAYTAGTMERATVGNVVGALSRAMIDSIDEATFALGDHNPTAIAALVHLSKYPGESVDGLRKPLQLSHPGCVRLVDRLAHARLVERRPAVDGRAVALHPTRAGMTAARAVLRKRAEALDAAVGALSTAEQQTLGRLVAKV